MSVEIERIVDCERMKVHLISVGIDRSLQECYDIWTKISKMVGVPWLSLPEESSLLWAELRPHVTTKAPPTGIKSAKEYADKLYWHYYNKYEHVLDPSLKASNPIVKDLCKDAVSFLILGLKDYGEDSHELQNMEWYWRYYDLVVEEIDKI